MKGTVKFYNNTKGWGFITDKETGNDVFVHYSNVVATNKKGRKSLRQNEIVEYEMDEGNDGKSQAVNVIPVVTMRIIKKSLKEEGLHVKRMECPFNTERYLVIDNSNNLIQCPEHGFSFEELAGYAGYEV